MKPKIKDFLKLYKQDKESIEKHEKYKQSGKNLHLIEYLEFTSFYLTSYSGWGIQIHRTPKDLIQLDEEDIQYFINKYSPKIEDEYQEKLKELNKKYGK